MVHQQEAFKMEGMIQISVVICCYNSEHRIGKTLESLLAQQFKNAVGWEVVLVDWATCPSS